MFGGRGEETVSGEGGREGGGRCIHWAEGGFFKMKESSSTQ